MPRRPFRLTQTERAESDYAKISAEDPKKLKKVKKALGQLQLNPRHPGLNTHEYHGFEGPNGEKVFEAYVENRTPAAYRIFFCYGAPGEIVILAITPHP